MLNTFTPLSTCSRLTISPYIAQRADLSWRTPEHQEDDTQAFPQEVEVTYEGTCVCIDGS